MKEKEKINWKQFNTPYPMYQELQIKLDEILFKNVIIISPEDVKNL